MVKTSNVSFLLYSLYCHRGGKKPEHFCFKEAGIREFELHFLINGVNRNNWSHNDNNYLKEYNLTPVKKSRDVICGS